MRHGSVFARSALALSLLGAVCRRPGYGGRRQCAHDGAELHTVEAAESRKRRAKRPPGRRPPSTPAPSRKAAPSSSGSAPAICPIRGWCSRCNFSSIKPQRTRIFAPEIRVTDAGFNANKQISDIHDLINSGVDAIIYWPVDDKAIEPALEDAVHKHIPTVNVGGGYSNAQGVTTNAYIDQYILGRMDAEHLMAGSQGQGQHPEPVADRGDDSSRRPGQGA